VATLGGVATRRADFSKAVERWKTVTDCLEGEDTIKERAELYLPRPSAYNRTAAGDQHYRAYLARAQAPAIVAPTVRGLVGTLHRKPAAVTLPARLDYLRDRASQDGLSLESFARRLSWDLIAYGRAPILVDLPRNGGMPRLIAYRPWELINWRESIIDGERRLSLAVLEIRRDADEQEDLFSHAQVTEWLVLRMDGGTYAIDIWRQQAADEAPLMMEQGIVPTVRGQPLTEIPLIVTGCNDVTPDVDEIPMLGLARLALSIYRNSADIEQGLFLAGNPTPYIAGMQPEVDPHTGQTAPIKLGPGGGYYIPDPQGKFGFAEVAGAGFEAQRANIESKFARAAQLGAAMLETEKRAAESGEALRLRQAAKTATLESVARAEGEAITQALRIAARWADADDTDVVYKANQDFIEIVMSAQDRVALVSSWLQGAIGRKALFASLKAGGALSQDIDLQAYLDDAEGATETETAPDAPEVA
jgi:hypothetical protein